MDIRKVTPTQQLKQQVEDAFARYEAAHGVDIQYAPFTFVAEEADAVIGVITGYTCFAEVYVEDLLVMEAHRGKGIGRQLMAHMEAYFQGKGLHNINLCTNAFQAPAFYEKCGYTLEFIRKNPNNPKLDKYFYVKFFDA